MQYLIEYGYIGLFIAAFLAATILPLSSEVVLSALLPVSYTHLDVYKRQGLTYRSVTRYFI